MTMPRSIYLRQAASPEGPLLGICLDCTVCGPPAPSPMSERRDLSGWPAARAAAVAAVEARGASPTQAHVAAVLGISPRTLRTRDYQAGIATTTMRATTPHEHSCAGCGKALPCRTGNHRRWHSEACRVAAFRRAHPAQPEQLRCACGAAYEHRRGLGRRPTACPQCRATALLAKAAARAAAILAVRR